MKMQLLIAAAGLVVATGLPAQTPPVVQPAQPLNFQQAGTMGNVVIRPLATAGGRGAVVTGSPFSAKEVRKTVQTLGDGTQLENTSTTLYYRDSLGRTRSEPQDGSLIVISDPVDGSRLQLNSQTKTAVRTTMPALAGGAPGGRGGGVMVSAPRATTDPVEALAKIQAELAAVAATQDRSKLEAAAKRPEPNIEDLGVRSQNGVMAQGTRSTMIIPQGQIGNNRDIRVVNERWYSKDLQMMVKTINSDPRFGVTTYELTDISQANPDAALFQVPPGYTLTEGVGRGRGGAGR